jgi:hypothetical protein
VQNGRLSETGSQLLPDPKGALSGCRYSEMNAERTGFMRTHKIRKLINFVLLSLIVCAFVYVSVIYIRGATALESASCAFIAEKTRIFFHCR